jgi:hypothetical protein
MMQKHKNLVEPTSGIEPLTCRLRNGSVLRMLLIVVVDSGAFPSVLGRSVGYLCSTLCSTSE